MTIKRQMTAGLTVTVEQLVRRWHDLEARRADIVDEQGLIKEQFRTLGLGKTTTDAGVVTVSPNRRFDPELAAQILAEINPDLVPACSISKVDSETTKRIVGDDVYERCLASVGKPKVTIS